MFWFCCSIAAVCSACATQVYFAPGDKATEVIVRKLGQVKSSLLVQGYSFTSAPIAKAVVDARRRGVKVTGSFNFTKHAKERNAGNLLIIDGLATVRRYATSWQAHARHSTAYVRQGK